MGYDVHITRADSWTESHERPIADAEWTTVIASDPELRPSEYNERNRFVAAFWTGYPGSGGGSDCFVLDDGKITETNPDETVLRKMVEIARKLDARVQGDDGEEYT
ncbi:MAG: hypothetical protein H8F28_19270 [Fibrella sp.]|nr:hypothetical protein [Armatimonadota bacterium]